MTPGDPERFEALVRRVDARGCEVVPAGGGEPIFCSVRDASTASPGRSAGRWPPGTG